MRLGPIEVPYSNGHYYKSQWMHTLSKEQLSEQKYGLGIATGSSFQTKIDGQTIVIAANNIIGTDPDGYNALAAQLYGHFRQHRVGSGNSVICAVPLYMWSPALLDLAIVYLGAGQDLQISGRFLPAPHCCLPLPGDDNATDMSYTVSNAMLITVKSVLDAPRIKALREQVVGPMPIVNAVSYKVPASTSVSREFTIPKGQFIRRIMISAHSKVSGKCAAVNNGIANLVSNANGKLKNLIHYMPPIAIDYLELKNGSQSMTLRAQQLKHLTATSFDSEYCMENPLLRKLRTVYAIDLSRWGEDYDASGSG